MPKKTAAAKKRASKSAKRTGGVRKRAVTATASRNRKPQHSGSGMEGMIVPKFLIGLLVLLPACYVTMEAFFALVLDLARGSSLLRESEFWCFVLGVVGWLAAFVWLPRPMLLYVFGHEATHATAAFFCGARVPHFKASSEGGYVYTTKSNFLISLAPYLFPFYTLIVLAAAMFLTCVVDVYVYRPDAVFGVLGIRWIWVIMILLGSTWCFHVTFTVWMIGKHQPDLVENGVFFSLSLIVLFNLLLLCVFLVMAAPDIRFADFWQDWAESLHHLVENLSRAGAGILWMIERGVEKLL